MRYRYCKKVTKLRSLEEFRLDSEIKEALKEINPHVLVAYFRGLNSAGSPACLEELESEDIEKIQEAIYRAGYLRRDLLEPKYRMTFALGGKLEEKNQKKLHILARDPSTIPDNEYYESFRAIEMPKWEKIFGIFREHLEIYQAAMLEYFFRSKGDPESIAIGDRRMATAHAKELDRPPFEEIKEWINDKKIISEIKKIVLEHDPKPSS